MSADIRDSCYFLGSADVSRKRRRISTISGILCQELDGSGLLDVSKTVMLWKQRFSDAMVSGSEESAKLKLDRRGERDWDCQEVDEYKTEGKVQLLHDTYT